MDLADAQPHLAGARPAERRMSLYQVRGSEDGTSSVLSPTRFSSRRTLFTGPTFEDTVDSEQVRSQ